MRMTGFSAIMAGLVAAALLAMLSLPLHAAGSGHGVPAPVAALPPKPVPLLDVPPDELSDSLRPAEPPPPDFTAAQFIDSAGCVFVRVADGWRARIARDGSAICGYPPTFSTRRTGPDQVTPLFPEPEEPRAARIERVLSETILGDLRDGELAGPERRERPDAEQSVAEQAVTGSTVAASDQLAANGSGHGMSPERPAAPTHQDTTSAGTSTDPLGVAAAMAAGPALRRQMAGDTPQNDRLCGLLGAAPAGNGSGGMALGLCASAPALTGIAPRKIAETADTGAGPALAADAPVAESSAKSLRGDRTPGNVAAAGKDRAPAGKVARTSTRKARKNGKASGEILIPPGAKYVQIGAFRDPANADRAARRLGEMGLPVVRSGGEGPDRMRLILVGPLDSREAMVRAIDRVRRAGYRDAYPRR